jgi:hypothetical protein
MLRFRFSFLPTFFTALTIAFVVAAAVRIHSYSVSPPPSLRRSAHEETTTSSARTGVHAPSIGDASVPTSESADGTFAAGSTVDPRRVAEREQRYNELLKTPAPAGSPAAAASSSPLQPHGGSSTVKQAVPATKPPQEKPGLLSRIGNAIVHAVTGGGSMTSSQPSSSGGSGEHSKDPEPNKDPNSDTTPPTLGTIDFSPPLVHDGEETTLVITASDDISGVRTISGNVISPSGALQGFALQRDGEGNRFVTRLQVPPEAAEGVWHINYLNLTDNASNSVTLSYAQGMLPATASFRVQSSRSDTTAPTLKAVWLDRPQMKAGEHDTIFVQADDDKSGVNLVSGVFISPSKFARVGFGCRQQNESNTWSCDIMPPSNVDCGDWQLEQIQLQDKANNMAAIRSDNGMVAAVKLNIISDACDSHPPVVESIMVDNTRVVAPTVINVTVQANDDASGVASVSGHFVFMGTMPKGTQPPRLYFSCRPTGDQPAVTWIGPLPVPDKAAKGLWKLGALQVLDKANNLKLYSQNDPVTANVGFTVQ